MGSHTGRVSEAAGLILQTVTLVLPDDPAFISIYHLANNKETLSESGTLFFFPRSDDDADSILFNIPPPSVCGPLTLRAPQMPGSHRFSEFITALDQGTINRFKT